MPSVKWSAHAIRCVQDLYAFLSEKDRGAARKAVGFIRARAALLATHPSLGRPALDLEPEHRELLIPFGSSGYVLLYHAHAQEILVLAVRHQKEVGF
jgi:toxin ParE1/3/4